MDVKKLKELIELIAENGEPASEGPPPFGLKRGTAVIVRCVTHYYTGRVGLVTDAILELRDAAWIPCTGRWASALKTGALEEVEPYPNLCYINRGAIVDWAPWEHDLPREVK